MSQALVAIGSNIDPEANAPAALELLAERFAVLSRSRVLRTAAIPAPGREAGPPQPDYLNSVVLIETNLSPPELRRALRAIEADLGRVRTADRYAPRTIDLDAIGIDGRITDPEVRRREFLRTLAAEALGDAAAAWDLDAPS